MAEFEAAREKISKYCTNCVDLQEWSVLKARIARLEILSE